jgi:phosphoglycolate phosphatase
MARAFEELFGVGEAFARIPMAGRTDAWILSDALAARGIPPDDPRVADYPSIYFQYLAQELIAPPPGARYGVLPGVRPLLEALARMPDVYLALLTGNYERSAEMKLAHFDLWRYFPCGAFGDAAPDRNGLLPRAMARVAACGGPRLAPDRVVIVGDTPLDVGVAVAGGARSLAVATGNHSASELRESGADVVFEDLSDTERVLEALQL